jgi:hypothetical protein
MRLQTILALVLSLFVLACGGGGGGSSNSSQGLAGPTNLRSLPDYSSGSFILTWNPPAAAIDGYNLEVQSGSGSFQQINPGLIDPTWTGIVMTFSASVPEDTNFAFRMNAVKGNQTSAYSNSVSVNSGLSSPGQPSGEYDWNQSGIALTWSRNSAVATGFKLERMELTSYGSPTGSWIPITVTDPLATSYLDTTAAMGTYYVYRVTNTKGSTSSPAGGASNSIFTGLPAPSQPTATFDFSGAGMSITWTKNTSFNDGVKLERIENTYYGTQVGTWTQLTVSNPTASSFLDTTVIANTYYSYRVTNLRGTVASATSYVSSQAFAGLQAVSSLSAWWDTSRGGVYLSWYTYATYDSLLIERSPSDSTGTPTGTWTKVATPTVSTTSYTDLSTRELTTYVYRISGVRGATTSASTSSYTATTPLAAPTGLAATGASGSVQLTWKNHSTAATQVVIRRAPAGYPYSMTDVAILSASSEGYVDLPSTLGYYIYSAVAKAGYSEAASPTATFATPNPADALTLSTVSHAFPDATDATVTPVGTWALASTAPFGVLSDNAPWTPYFPNNSQRAAADLIQVDAQGHPHLVYLILDPQNSQEAILRHVWFSGTDWLTEDMGRTQLLYSYPGAGYVYTLDGAGVPQALLDQAPNGGSTSTLTYIHKVNGVWTREAMTAFAPVISFNNYRLKLDNTGAPHVLLGSYGALYECTRTPQGDWSASALPAGSSLTNDFLEGCWTDADNATVVYSTYGSYPTYGTTLTVLQKVGGNWQSPSNVAPADAGVAYAQMAQSPDRARLVLVLNTYAGLKAYHLDGAGWHETLLADLSNNNYSPMYRVDFDASNKVHILYKNVYPATGYIEFKE